MDGFIPDVRIVLTASNSWFGRTMRKLTGDPVSHVFIEYTSELWGGRWAAEATLPEVRKVPAAKSRHHIVAEFKCKFNARPGLQAIAHYFGSPYDTAQILFMGWVAIAWKWLKLKIRSPFRNPKDLVCSELVTHFFKGADLEEARDMDPEKIRPLHILNYCTYKVSRFEKVVPQDT